MRTSTRIGLNKVTLFSFSRFLRCPQLVITADATSIFSYATEQRLQCTDCKRVRYRTDTTDIVSVAVAVKEKGTDVEGKVLYEDVQLWQCLDALLGTEALEYACPACEKSVHALK